METLYLVISEYNREDWKSYAYTIASTSLKDYILRNNLKRMDISKTYVKGLGKPAIKNMLLYFIITHNKEDEFHYEDWEVGVWQDEKHYKKIERNIQAKLSEDKCFKSDCIKIVYK